MNVELIESKNQRAKLHVTPMRIKKHIWSNPKKANTPISARKTKLIIYTSPTSSPKIRMSMSKQKLFISSQSITL